MRLCLVSALMLGACTGPLVQPSPRVDLAADAVHAPAVTAQKAEALGLPDPLFSGLNAQAVAASTAAAQRALLSPAGAELWAVGTSSGTVDAGPFFFVNAMTCRDLAHTVRLADRERVGRVTHCRAPGMDWLPVGEAF